MQWIGAIVVYILLRVAASLLGIASEFVDNADWAVVSQVDTNYRVDSSGMSLSLDDREDI